MKALTLTQPWAWLICAGRKRYETRSWRTYYRGPLAIHAAATLNADARTYASERQIDLKSLPLGQIVATANVLDCIPTMEVRDKITAQERDAGDYSDGRWAWKLSDIRVLPKPVPAKGTLGLWSWNETICDQIIVLPSPPANCGAGVPPATHPDRRGQNRTPLVPPASSRQGALKKRTNPDKTGHLVVSAKRVEKPDNSGQNRTALDK